jgi:hypothetical protein
MFTNKRLSYKLYKEFYCRHDCALEVLRKKMRIENTIGSQGHISLKR